MEAKEIKSLRVFFITVNASYQIVDVFGGMKDNKNWHDTKKVIELILLELEGPSYCEDYIKVLLLKFEKCLEAEINVKAPKFAAGGIIPTA